MYNRLAYTDHFFPPVKLGVSVEAFELSRSSRQRSKLLYKEGA